MQRLPQRSVGGHLPALLLAGVMAAPQPAQVAKPRLQMFFAADFTDTAYRKDALSRVLKVWKAPRPHPETGKKAVVISTIGRDGSVLEASLHMKSGSEPWDQAAIAAVRAAAPFLPLPGSFPRSSVEVHWHFEAAP